MSASRNAESMANQGEFRSRVPPSEPMQTSGHKPGVKVGNDAYPEFHAEQYPAGTAPAERSFQPRPAEGEAPARTFNHADAVPGATSADLHTGLGKPVQGQENREIDRKRANKRESAGLEGVGASAGVDMAKLKRAHLPGGGGGSESGGARGKASAEYPGAEDRVPESAEAVAAERNAKGRAYG